MDQIITGGANVVPAEVEAILTQHPGVRDAAVIGLEEQMRTGWPGESDLVFMAFDLLHQVGVDVRHLALAERKRDLERLCRRAKVPFMRQVQTFPNGERLFEHLFGFEGEVSKGLYRPYASGLSKAWMQVKCPNWKRDNSQRYRMFEGDKGAEAPSPFAEPPCEKPRPRCRGKFDVQASTIAWAPILKT